MKKLILTSIISLSLLVGCAANPVSETTTSEATSEVIVQTVNPDYIKDILSALEKTSQFESMEFIFTDNQSGDTSITKYLLSKNPAMGYSVSYLEPILDIKLGETIFITDENIIGMLTNNNDMYSPPEYTLMPVTNLQYYIDGNFVIPVIDYNANLAIFSDIANIERIEKNDTGYIISFSEEFFKLQKQTQLSALEQYKEYLKEVYSNDELKAVLASVNQQVLMVESMEKEDILYNFVIENEIVTNVNIDYSYTQLVLSKTGELSSEKQEVSFSQSGEIIRFNDNENIQNEIKEIASFIQ